MGGREKRCAIPPILPVLPILPILPIPPTESLRLYPSTKTSSIPLGESPHRLEAVGLEARAGLA